MHAVCNARYPSVCNCILCTEWFLIQTLSVYFEKAIAQYYVSIGILSEDVSSIK